MSNGSQTRKSVKKSSQPIRRNALIIFLDGKDSSNIQILEAIPSKVKSEIEAVCRTIRTELNVAIPALDLKPYFERVGNPAPRQSIEFAVNAFLGRPESTVNDLVVIIRDGPFASSINITPFLALSPYRIYGIGLDIDAEKIFVELNRVDGFTAVFRAGIEYIGQILFDLFLDEIAELAPNFNLIRSDTGFRTSTIFQAKIKYLKQLKIIMPAPHNYSGELVFVSTAARKWFGSVPTFHNIHEFDPKRFSELWQSIARNVNLQDWLEDSDAEYPSESEIKEAKNAILQSHINAGQISLRKLENRLRLLKCNEYTLYFLLRLPNTRSEKNRLLMFFNRSHKSRLRTQLWTLYSKGHRWDEIRMFVETGFVTVYSFFLGKQL